MPIPVKNNIPLAPYTTLKIGGPADYFIEIKTASDLTHALAFAQKKHLPYYILGSGSNVLVSDAGFRGVIIKMANTSWNINGTTVHADANVPLPLIAKKTAEAGLTGMEFGIGVPGSVGGAVYGNAGAFGQETKNVLAYATALMLKTEFDTAFSSNSHNEIQETQSTMAIVKIESSSCAFAYRESIFKKNKQWVILSASFELAQDSKEACQKRMTDMLHNKTTNQPMGEKAAGSIFKNPPGHHAWQVIDEVEMRGYSIGGAQVSPQHTNYIVNRCNATAEQMVMLIAMIKQRVRDRCCVELQEEIQYVGF